MVDHIDGSRRGQRQEFAPNDRIRFGRHPDNEVSFDAHRDLDASSRHAELRRRGEDHVLCDVGSSNGTFVGDQRINEAVLAVGVAIEVEFGSGGPRVRIMVGDDQTIAALPEIRLPPREYARRRLAIIAGLVLITTLIVSIWWRFGG